MQNKFCLSKIGMARQYCISLENKNYNDIGTLLEFRQGNNIRITTLLQRWCQVRKRTSKTQQCKNVSFSSYYWRQKHNVVTTLWQRYPTSQPKYNQKKVTLAQVVSCEFCEITKNFYTEHVWATAKTIYLKMRIFIQLIIIM